MANIKLKKGDKVKIIAGKDKGKEGKILVVDRKKARVIVEGRNMIAKHQKATTAEQKGGIVTKENYIDASNVMYIHNGKPTRLGVKIEIVEKDGKKKVVKHRVAKSTGETID